VLTTTTATAASVSLRTVSQFTVCWRGNAGCSNGGQMGWRMELPGGSEQVIYDPQVVSGLFVVNTTVPASNAPLSCNARPPSGYTMAIAVGSGGAPPASVFSTNNSATFDPLGGQVIAGAGLDATGTMTVVRAQGQPSFVFQKSDGSQGVRRANLSGLVGTRLTWRKIR
jgi:type IV pilus assembly protein PilY1